jgi:hypothetical protein
VSEWISDVRSGVRQGCVIAPLLCNIHMDCVVQSAGNGRKGKTVGRFKHFGKMLGTKHLHSNTKVTRHTCCQLCCLEVSVVP